MSDELIGALVYLAFNLIGLFFEVLGAVTFIYSIIKVVQEEVITNTTIYRFCFALILHFLAAFAYAANHLKFLTYSNFIFAILVAVFVIRNKFFINLKPT